MTLNAIKRNAGIWKLVHNCVIKPSLTKTSFFVCGISTILFLFVEYLYYVSARRIDLIFFILLATQWSLTLQAIIFAFYSRDSSSFINTMKCSRYMYTKKLPVLMQTASLLLLPPAILLGAALEKITGHTPAPFLTKGFVISCLFYNLLLSIWIPFTISRGKNGFIKRGWCTYSSIKDSMFSTEIAGVLAVLVVPLASFLARNGEDLLEGHMMPYVCICLALILLAYAVSRIEMTVYYTKHR